MFGTKKIKINSGLKIWIKKLNILDFAGCDYVPLIYSSVIRSKTHERRNEKAIDHKDVLKPIFEKSIIKIKSKTGMTKDEFLDLVLNSENIAEVVYTYIHVLTFKKKILNPSY